MRSSQRLCASALTPSLVKGAFGALALGALLYVFSTCGFGQLVSTLTRTQVAAVFATTILAVIPTVNFSGLLVPVSSLTGQGRLIGLLGRCSSDG